MMRTLAVSALVASVRAWEPEACSELADGVPCRTLYEHPQGSQFVTPCPLESYTNPDGCGAQFDGKSEEQLCLQPLRHQPLVVVSSASPSFALMATQRATSQVHAATLALLAKQGDLQLNDFREYDFEQ